MYLTGMNKKKKTSIFLLPAKQVTFYEPSSCLSRHFFNSCLTNDRTDLCAKLFIQCMCYLDRGFNAVQVILHL